MSFQQALSGLSAASRNLEVIGNNIANANTIGAKSSRAEFAEVYAASMGATGSAVRPMGVRVATIAQDFSQGNITTTGNDLDLAINGSGFFQVRMTDGTLAYTRNGEFKLDRDGYIVSNSGAQVMGFETDIDGVITNTTPGAIQLPAGGTIAPRATTAITAVVNLDARTPVATATTPLTQTSTTLVTYDPQGIEVPVSLYFKKTAANQWEVHASVNSDPPAVVGTLDFDANGVLTTAAPLSITLPAPLTGTYDVDFAGSVQLGTAFAVNELQQDGWAPGELNGIKIGSDGVIMARYSNGQQQALATVMLASFRNPQGLTPMGDNMWIESLASGGAVRGAPGESGLGSLASGALEESNVDLTGELVAMMTAQRSYQANAQTVKTIDQVMSTLLNMR